MRSTPCSESSTTARAIFARQTLAPPCGYYAKATTPSWRFRSFPKSNITWTHSLGTGVLSQWTAPSTRLEASHTYFGELDSDDVIVMFSGVGYAGELHLIHRNTRFPTMEMALKQPNGVLAIAVFLNVGDLWYVGVAYPYICMVASSWRLLHMWWSKKKKTSGMMKWQSLIELLI